jgi:hypothetical protein
MNAFDIYLANHSWKNSVDARPFVLVSALPNGDWKCFPISKQDYDGHPFEVLDSDPDFKATGLRMTSYIYDFRFEIVKAAEFVLPNGKVARWGQLEGDLLKRFLVASGLD